MLIKNNRFFGRDISNILPSITRNQSQQPNEKNEKNIRRQSINHQEKDKKLQNKSSDPSQSLSKQTCIPLPISIVNNSQCLPEYFSDIFHYMLQHQLTPLGNYCEKTINIDKSTRGELINFIIEVHYKFKLFPQTLYIIIYFIDKYLSLKNVQKSKLKLVGLSALYMASKYEQTYRVPQIKDILGLCSYSYTKRDILQTQADIIKTLQFDLIFDSSFKFLQALHSFTQMTEKNFYLAQYLLELALTQSEFLQYKQSILAASTFYLVCKIRKVEIDWDEKYYELTRYKQTELHKCARELCNLLQRIDKINHVTALKKKFSEEEYCEVTRLKLQRKK